MAIPLSHDCYFALTKVPEVTVSRVYSVKSIANRLEWLKSKNSDMLSRGWRLVLPSTLPLWRPQAQPGHFRGLRAIIYQNQMLPDWKTTLASLGVFNLTGILKDVVIHHLYSNGYHSFAQTRIHVGPCTPWVSKLASLPWNNKNWLLSAVRRRVQSFLNLCLSLPLGYSYIWTLWQDNDPRSRYWDTWVGDVGRLREKTFFFYFI